MSRASNVAIEYRWAEDRFDRLPELAADLVRRQVAVIAAPANDRRARGQGCDHDYSDRLHRRRRPGQARSRRQPRPAGRQRDWDQFFHHGELAAKRLGLLRELVPGAVRVAVLVNPANRTVPGHDYEPWNAAARDLGLQVQIYDASTSREIDAAFARLCTSGPTPSSSAPDPFFLTRRVQLATLAARHALPATYSCVEFAEAGGLMSYGTSLADMYRQVGIYSGRILKGEKPARPAGPAADQIRAGHQPQTARMLGLDVPPTLLARADEVIE